MTGKSQKISYLKVMSLTLLFIIPASFVILIRTTSLLQNHIKLNATSIESKGIINGYLTGAIHRFEYMPSTRKNAILIGFDILTSSILILSGIIAFQRRKPPFSNKLRKIFANRKQSKDYIRSVFDASQNAIIVFDENGRIINDLNNSVLLMFGYERHELIGKNFDILFPSEDLRILKETRDDFSTDIDFAGIDAPFFGETIGLRKDGSTFPIKVLFGKDKKIKVVSIMDVTRERDWASRMIDAKKEAELSNQSKSEFLNNISHELRTPLHAMINFSKFGLKKLSKKEDNPEKLWEYFNNIYISAERQLALVNDLLDLSKLEAKKASFDIRRNEIHTVIHHSVINTKSQMDARNITLELDLNKTLLFAWFDHNKINQVLINLLANAAKFSPHGSQVTLRTSASIKYDPDTGKKMTFLRISVTDQGPGIDLSEKELLFDKFYQSSKTREGGTGLGLSICKEIIKGHKGIINVFNNPDNGATFYFELPMTQEKDHAHEANL